ncbi:hypothetical protein MTR_1g055000 [Medicago truncatula]|uniref:Uncharacterized protein n=1 Tax=Medicago truncatula TaxID=3880 RepID=A0A072VJP5_MEDTR|nr:hypothetical protein MTR_1g055000 [Medicago truncatula]
MECSSEDFSNSTKKPDQITTTNEPISFLTGGRRMHNNASGFGKEEGDCISIFIMIILRSYEDQ